MTCFYPQWCTGQGGKGQNHPELHLRHQLRQTNWWKPKQIVPTECWTHHTWVNTRFYWFQSTSCTWRRPRSHAEYRQKSLTQTPTRPLCKNEKRAQHKCSYCNWIHENFQQKSDKQWRSIWSIWLTDGLCTSYWHSQWTLDTWWSTMRPECNPMARGTGVWDQSIRKTGNIGHRRLACWADCYTMPRSFQRKAWTRWNHNDISSPYSHRRT